MLETTELQSHMQDQWIFISISLLIGLIGLAIAKKRGALRIFNINPPVPIRGKDVLIGFSLFLFIEMIIAPLIVAAILFWKGEEINDLHFTPFQKGLVNLFVILSGFFAIVLSNLTLPPANRKVLWNQSVYSFLYQCKIGIISWFVAYPLVLAFSQLIAVGVSFISNKAPIEQHVVQQLRENAGSELFTFLGMAIVILVPMTEEYLFRGLLQNWLKQKWNSRVWAIGISSLIFTAFHYSSSQGVSNIELLSSLFFLSCILGFLYEKQQSLWASIGLHAFFNFMTILFIYSFPVK
jgi:uncharacterized protein